MKEKGGKYFIETIDDYFEANRMLRSIAIKRQLSIPSALAGRALQEAIDVFSNKMTRPAEEITIISAEGAGKVVNWIELLKKGIKISHLERTLLTKLTLALGVWELQGNVIKFHTPKNANMPIGTKVCGTTADGEKLVYVKVQHDDMFGWSLEQRPNEFHLIDENEIGFAGSGRKFQIIWVPSQSADSVTQQKVNEKDDNREPQRDTADQRKMLLSKFSAIINESPEWVKKAITVHFDKIDRLHDLGSKIAASAKEGQCINVDWVSDYNSLIEEIKNYK